MLERIYALYDDFIQRRGLACKAGCARCCTRNVSVTSLEAERIARHLENTGPSALLESLASAQNLPRFQPLTTTNTLAHLCRNGKTPPEETTDPAWSPCPFLVENHCPIYAARPFACRCMVSTVVCRKGGRAEMDDYLLAVHTVFLQFIEHADAAGCTGNLIDMVLTATDDGGWTNGTSFQSGFVPNRPLEMILLPPEYQARGRKIVTALSALFK